MNSSVDTIQPHNSNTLVIAEGITSKEDFYAEMKRLLKLADWFGNNLDALNDALFGGCGEIDPRGKTFVWKSHVKARENLGSNIFDKILEIFKDNEKAVELM